MPSGRGKIVLMGSGEMTTTMVEVHKSLLKQLGRAPRAAFLEFFAGYGIADRRVLDAIAEAARTGKTVKL